MKIKNKYAAIFLFAFVVLFKTVSPTFSETPNQPASAEKVKKETQDLIKTLKSYTADQRDEAVEKTKNALDQLDERIGTLEKQISKDWNKMSQATRDKTQETLKALRKQRLEVAEWMGRLKESSTDAWDHVKKGFSEAYKAFHQTWEKTEKDFSK